MISVILGLLKDAKGETENIRIAQGKYKLPTGIIESFKQIKKESKWQGK